MIVFKIPKCTSHLGIGLVLASVTSLPFTGAGRAQAASARPVPRCREIQKSSVIPSATASSAFRLGQSAEEMSQKPHSLGLGTLRAGSGALSRSTN